MRCMRRSENDCLADAKARLEHFRYADAFYMEENPASWTMVADLLKNAIVSEQAIREAYAFSARFNNFNVQKVREKILQASMWTGTPTDASTPFPLRCGVPEPQGPPMTLEQILRLFTPEELPPYTTISIEPEKPSSSLVCSSSPPRPQHSRPSSAASVRSHTDSILAAAARLTPARPPPVAPRPLPERRSWSGEAGSVSVPALPESTGGIRRLSSPGRSNENELCPAPPSPHPPFGSLLGQLLRSTEPDGTVALPPPSPPSHATRMSLCGGGAPAAGDGRLVPTIRATGVQSRVQDPSVGGLANAAMGKLHKMQAPTSAADAAAIPARRRLQMVAVKEPVWVR